MNTHNLRTPVASIMGLINLIKHNLKEGEEISIESVNMLEDSSIKLDEVVKDLQKRLND